MEKIEGEHGDGSVGFFFINLDWMEGNYSMREE